MTRANNNTHHGSLWLSLLLTAILVACVALCLPAHAAFADTEEIDDAPSELQQRVEETAAAYNEATAKVEEAEKLVAENEARLTELREQIPIQREKSATAMRELYKMQKDGFSLVSAVVDASSLGEFLDTVTYLTYVQNKNLYEIMHLAAMEDELATLQDDLIKQRDEAVENQKAAEAALEEAKAIRQQAIEEARAKAEAEAKAAAEREAAAQQAASSGASGTSSSSGSNTSAQTVTPVSNGNEDRDAFIAEWAPRIDAYMAGYPLEGYGSVFAAAAWDNCVDPRFSPAISCVESTKGMYCFRSHNAWGWGSVSWDSWEEAINAHVRGLARGYGYTVTEAAAQKYCPPTWQHWYGRVVEEMNKI